MDHYDAIVVGAGPGGATCAAYLAMDNLKVLLIDKEEFPRDKICGDALGGKSLSHVHAIGAHDSVINSQHYKYTGITMSSANGNSMTIPLVGNEFAHNTAGYVVPRKILDNALFESAQDHVLSNNGTVKVGCKVKSIMWGADEEADDPGPGSGDSRIAKGLTYIDQDRNEISVQGSVIIGAGGYNCPIAKELVKDTYSLEYQERPHWCAAFREYYSNVKGCKEENGEIEIHFIDEIIPGYFWIFPAGDGFVNVGIGMRLDYMDKSTVKLKEMQDWVINHHPIFKERFADSTRVEGSNKGWLLPLGSPRKDGRYEPRRAAGNRVLLVGDAASLIDPFSGEGIGNAMVSAKFAADTVSTIIQGGNPIQAGVEYMEKIWDDLGPELINSYKLQRMLKRKRLMNWVIGKAGRKPKIQAMLTDMLASKKAQEKVHSKWFLIKAFLF